MNLSRKRHGFTTCTCDSHVFHSWPSHRAGHQVFLIVMAFFDYSWFHASVDNLFLPDQGGVLFVLGELSRNYNMSAIGEGTS